MPAKGVQATLPSQHHDGGVSISGPRRSTVPPSRSGAPAGRPGHPEQPAARAAGPAILVGDGDVPLRRALDDAWPGWAHGATLVIAADGGARKAARAGLRPDLVVGDADSLGPDGLAEVRAAGIPVELAAVAKDESDLELAVIAAIDRGASRVTILGALGGPRFDHAVANAWLLAHSALHGIPTVLLDATTRVRLLDAGSAPASVTLTGRPGDLISIFPFGAAAVGITTDGLAYPLRDEPLPAGPARGLSNVRIGAEACVSLRSGRLLVIETRNPDGGPG